MARSKKPSATPRVIAGGGGGKSNFLPPGKSKTWRRQKFKDAWLREAKFKGWLQKDDSNEFRCRCLACDVNLICGKSELDRHATNASHSKNVQNWAMTKKLDQMFPKVDKNLQRATQRFELTISNFFAEHNAAIQMVEHLIPALKISLPDSKIIQNASLPRQKCTGIIKNVIAPETTRGLVDVLKRVDFSVLLDETTTITRSKVMCVLVRFVDPENGVPRTELLNLMKLDARHGDAETLYNQFKKLLETHDIPLTNIIGLCSDNASVMIGRFNSFASRLLKDAPRLIEVRCICHSGAIVANKSCLALPRGPEALVRQVYNYVSGSAKRCAELEEIQEFFNEKKLKILNIADTRWLSVQHAVERILINWEVLTNYFRVAVVEDKLKAAELILTELENQCTKAYLCFMDYVLNYFNTMNALFQSKKPLVHQLQTESIKLFMKLGQNFIKDSALKPTVNVRDPHNYLNLEQLYLGPKCAGILKGMPKKERERVQLDCLQFYIVASEEMQLRLPMKEGTIWSDMKFLDPDYALSRGEQHQSHNFATLCQKANIDEGKVEKEWRDLSQNYTKDEKLQLKTEDVVHFWWQIKNARNFKKELLFPNLAKLATHILSLPHANSDAERIFSMVTDILTKKRNRLGHDVLDSMCIIRSNLQSADKTCVTFQFNENHFANMTANKIYGLTPKTDNGNGTSDANGSDEMDGISIAATNNSADGIGIADSNSDTDGDS